MIDTLLNTDWFLILIGFGVTLIITIYKLIVKVFTLQIESAVQDLQKKMQENISGLEKKIIEFKVDSQLNMNDAVDKAVERQKKHDKDNLENIKNMAIKVIDQRFEKAEKLLEEVLEIEKRIIDKNEK